ncbi:MAG TPA: hypothetical protein PLZ08_01385 [Bacillota bacterium]|nr:hypothetical protein [Bacillota bacterium]HOL08902.1 hypothetical protein [Bacillota bacterium]HPO96595.1 hypothetical protein [Bacillota bacterium]
MASEEERTIGGFAERGTIAVSSPVRDGETTSDAPGEGESISPALTTLSLLMSGL